MAASAYFKVDARHPTIPEIAAYRQRRMACVVFPVDAEAATGQPPVPNEEVAETAVANPDVLVISATVITFIRQVRLMQPSTRPPSRIGIAIDRRPSYSARVLA